MSRDNEDECFEVAGHQQQVREIQAGKSSLLGQANPIYAKKIEQTDIDYDGSIALKYHSRQNRMLPVMLSNDIKNYVPFKLGNKNKNETSKKQKEEKDPDVEQNSAELAKIKFFTNQQNPIMKFFGNDEIVYCKFNNSRHNLFKEVSYFAGTFIPRDILSSKIRSNWRQEKIINNIGQLIQGKNKSSAKVVSSLSNEPFLTKKNCVQFDSKFESGNLFSAFKTGKYEYGLVLNNDINSKGSTQWFFFSVEGMEVNVDYTFNIVNFTKNDSLFNYGMKPAYYSITQNNGISPLEQNGESNRKGWYRCGKDISYYKGEIQRQNNNKYYYTLSFKISSRFPNDKVYIAHSYPYTYTRCLNLMKSLISKSGKNQEQKKSLKNKAFSNVQEIKIGKTIGNRQMLAYLISPRRTTRPPKQCIVIMARQHPGQTQGSFVCEGIIKLFTQPTPSKQIKFLLENYQVYVIPMVNPDGVIFGNYRTNLSGKDLNRKWDSNDPNNLGTLLVPEVVAIKQFITSLTKVSNLSIRFVLDLHGHSKKLNSFFYGNPCPDNPEVTKIYPYICSRFSEAIQYMDCTFACQQYKKKAARVYLSSVLQQLHVYTFQSSFYGYRNRQGKIIEFTPAQYGKLGQNIIKSLYILLIREKDTENPQNSTKTGSDSEEPVVKQSIQTYLKLEKELKQNVLLMKIGDAQSSGSQSRPQQGQLNNEDIVYISEQQEENDSRVVVNSSKVPTKQLSQKAKAEVSKTKSIRINSRKTVQNNTIEYKEFSKQYRNKKLITISQVNGVLADKYHISLLPIERIAYKIGKKVDVEVQTDKTDKLAIRLFKHFQIQQKNGLTGFMDFAFEEPSEDQSVASNIFGAKGQSLSQKGSQQQKRHSQIVAEIEKNGRNFAHRSNNETQKQLINKRKLSQIVSIKQPPNRNPKPKKRQIFTQTIATFRNLPIKQTKQLNPLEYSNQILIKQRELQNESRIAQMEKINKEVLRIYSKKSTIIDMGSKPKIERSIEKNNKDFSAEKMQLGSFKRY